MRNAPSPILVDVRKLRLFLGEQADQHEDTVVINFDDRHASALFQSSVQVALNLMYRGDGGITESVRDAARSLRASEDVVYRLVRDVATEILATLQEYFDEKIHDCGVLYRISYFSGNHLELEIQGSNRDRRGRER